MSFEMVASFQLIDDYQPKIIGKTYKNVAKCGYIHDSNSPMTKGIILKAYSCLNGDLWSQRNNIVK